MRFYSINETFKSLFRNRLMSVASVSSVVAALLILGIVMSIILNINSFSEGIKHQFDDIDVYLSDELTNEEILQIGKEIEKIDGIHSIIFVTREQAMENFKMDWGDYSYLLDGLEYNPLPNTYIINLEDILYADSIVESMKAIKGIEEIKFYKDLVNDIIDVTSYVRNIGLILVMILAVIATFLINNTIKLTINSRRREIFIMKYVGATSWHIRWPFILEGMIFGFLGAIISTGLVYLMYSYSFKLITSKYYVALAAYILNVDTIFYELIYLNIIIGVGIGTLGSLISIRRYLEV